MTQPGNNEEDRTPSDAADEPAGAPDIAAPQQDSTDDDDVQGHAYTGALKDKDRLV